VDQGNTKGTPAFFVPAATPENSEEVYADLARIAGAEVPPLRERVYSIEFVHDGETWTATVGEKLRGLKPPRPKRRRRPQSLDAPTPRLAKLGDPAIVLAIFRGPYTFVVVTNHRIGGWSVGSAWENPFFAGEPTEVVRFSAPQSP